MIGNAKIHLTWRLDVFVWKYRNAQHETNISVLIRNIYVANQSTNTPKLYIHRCWTPRLDCASGERGKASNANDDGIYSTCITRSYVCVVFVWEWIFVIGCVVSPAWSVWLCVGLLWLCVARKSVAAAAATVAAVATTAAAAAHIQRCMRQKTLTNTDADTCAMRIIT